MIYYGCTFLVLVTLKGAVRCMGLLLRRALVFGQDIFRYASISSSDHQDWLAYCKWTVPQIPQIPQISSLKMECHLKWNVTQNGMSLKMEYYS